MLKYFKNNSLSLILFYIFLILHLIFTKLVLKAIILNFIPLLFLSIVILLIFNRLALAIFIPTLLYCFLEFANFIKMQFLMQPLLATDLIFLSNFNSVITTITPFLNSPIAILKVFSISSAVIISILFIYYRTLPFIRLAKFNFFMRAVMIFCAVILIIVSYTELGNLNSVTHQLLKENLPWKINLKKYGVIGNLLSSSQLSVITKPPQVIGLEIIKNYTKSNYSNNESSSKPDIIAWLNESTFDPKYINLPSNKFNEFKMFQPNILDVTNGLLNVHTYGGGTAITEFGFLTGVPPRNFGSIADYAHITLSPYIIGSFVTELKESGYKTIAIYPLHGEFINARSAYHKYGFDEFYGADDYKTNVTKSEYVSDMQLADLFIEQLQKNNTQPIFVLVLTMSNHTPHLTNLTKEQYFEDFSKYLKPDLNSKFNDYLNRLKLTDLAITRITDFIQNRARKTLFIYFGDHLPEFGNQLPFKTETGATDYMTSFHIRANYKVTPITTYPVTDITFLSGLILDFANLNKSDFYQANSLMRKRCHGLLFNCINQDKIYQSYFEWLYDRVDK